MTVRGFDEGEVVGHPYAYYHRPGMPLRPPPPRLVPSPNFDYARRNLLSPFVDVSAEPLMTPLVRLLQDHYWQGDEQMDAVVEKFREISMRRGRALLDQALDHGIDSVPDAPHELRDLFAALDNPPAWHDPETWERGRRLWINTSSAARIGMVAQDAIGTFVGEEVSSSVGATGRFVRDPIRRGLETMLFFRGVTLPGALDRFSPEFKRTVHVRLMHAQVRAGLRRSWGDEHFAYHGNPISTALTMGAGTTFGLLPVLIDRWHGRTYTDEQMDAVMRYWSYICYVMGVAPEIIPTTAEDGLRILDYAVMTSGGPTAWTDRMATQAVARVNNETPVPLLLQRVMIAPIVGWLAYYAGEVNARGLFRSTPFHDVRIGPWVRLLDTVVRANVTYRRATDLLPARELRMQWRARHGDPLQRSVVLLTSALPRRARGSGPLYTHHDHTPDTPTGCPIRL